MKKAIGESIKLILENQVIILDSCNFDNIEHGEKINKQRLRTLKFLKSSEAKD